ncbi:reticulon-4-interacting protein 1, mitochondrial precursor [Camillea tinctor]|nr:reticulon-4-interacting protein 1, mitochondrial precursor [Camillea tinctor]
MAAEENPIPTAMRAWLYTSVPSTLERALTLSPSAPFPPSTALAPDELLVRVRAASLNPADYKVPELGPVRRLIVSAPASPGLDYAGVVVRVGDAAAATFKTGDRVFGRVEAPTPFGSLGEYVVVRRRGCAGIPGEEEAGKEEEFSCVGTAGLTAYQGIAPYVTPGKGDRVFINGGSGGVGTFSIQIAKALGCYVVVSCSAAGAELCRSLGADEIIDYRTADVCAELTSKAAASGPFALVVDNVGTSPPGLYKAADGFLSPEGTFAQIGGEVSLAMLRSVSRALIPRFLGGGSSKWAFIVTRNVHEELVRLAEWIREGKIRVVIDEVFPFEEAPAAFAKLKEGRTKGKVVVRVAEK